MLKIYVKENRCYLERNNTEIESELAELNVVVNAIIQDVSKRTNIDECELINEFTKSLNTCSNFS